MYLWIGLFFGLSRSCKSFLETCTKIRNSALCSGNLFPKQQQQTKQNPDFQQNRTTLNLCINSHKDDANYPPAISPSFLRPSAYNFVKLSQLLIFSFTSFLLCHLWSRNRRGRKLVQIFSILRWKCFLVPPPWDFSRDSCIGISLSIGSYSVRDRKSRLRNRPSVTHDLQK